MAAQLEESRGSQRAFLLSISHDLRTPLTSIRGYAEALADGTLDGADPGSTQTCRDGDQQCSAGSSVWVKISSISPASTAGSSPCTSPVCRRRNRERRRAGVPPQAHDLGLELRVLPVVACVPSTSIPIAWAQIVANLVESAIEVHDLDRRGVDRAP